MDSPFTYNKYVTGKNFLCRKKDVSTLSNLLSQSENVVIYSAPKAGKTSLIQQTILEMKAARKNFCTASVEMHDLRDCTSFLCRVGDAALRAYCTTPDEYRSIIAKLLPGTHFIFDQRNYSDHDKIVSLNWDPDENDVKAMLSLPFNLAKSEDRQLYLLLDDFQSITTFDGYEKLLKQMEGVIREQRSLLEPVQCSLIITGSRLNAMKDLFEHHHYFYRLCETFTMSPIDEKEVVEHIVKGFLTGGKVVDRNLLQGVCSLFKGDIWYINHFFAICDHLSKGYIMEPVLLEALDCLLSIHEPKFKAMMDDLTTFQVNLLKAVTEGCTRFSSAEVIRQYSLSSSANVKRLKDALMKKEILTFDSNENPQIIDPLFEYWVKKYFFKQEVEL